MLHFNNSNIFTGYIKQLLSAFKLPNLRVVKDGIVLCPGQLYIHNNDIIQIISDTPLLSENITSNDYNIISSYTYNKGSEPGPATTVDNSLVKKQTSYIPYTKQLENQTLVYDSYTHKYLGEYLRFLKDYKHIDLMSLYNCFSNEICNNMDVTFNVNKVIDEQSYTWTYNFDSKDSGYKIYMLPVRFFEKYTIAIDCGSPVEVVCGLYHKDSIASVFNWSYKKYNNLQFTSPVIYDNLSDYVDMSTYMPSYKTNLPKESTLMMFIKVPYTNDSSVVVLEGDYVSNADFILDSNSIMKWNRSIVNIESLGNGDIDSGIPNLISPLQLLNYNSGVQYPFADRLIEYLVNNTVDGLDDTADNVERVQRILLKRVNQGNDHFLKVEHYGTWDEIYKYLLYGLAVKNTGNMAKDTLGYYDKDLEQLLGDINIYNIKVKKEDIYK